ncbi:ABC transporter permease [uncultured Jatrophihabitans sp.]|uniref:ABC transporter permease n=1 Tax=uncultured Jatrophihabitans sp. TaxID=1610747 RepID=UPI0035CB2EE4
MTTMDAAAESTPGSARPVRTSALRLLLRDRAAVAGVVVIVIVVVVALAAPLVVRIPGQDPYTYHRSVLNGRGAPRGAFGGVSGSHWFGVEPLTGRDLFSIVVYGARTSILVGLAATVISTVIGTVVGAAAALFGGWIDRLLSRVVDVMFGIPVLIFMIALGAFAPTALPKWLLVTLIVGFLGWPPTARIVRAQCLSLVRRNFVLASRAMGGGPWHVLREQLLPNLLGILIVVVTVAIPYNIGYEAALAFLGVGVPPPTPSWGRTISSAIAWIATDPWYLLGPAGALFVITFAFNLLGDGLRDAFDPRAGGRR